jgi:hypothetical protein
MEHDVHLSDDVDRGGMLAKIIGALIVAAVFIGIGGYIVFASGLWA